MRVLQIETVELFYQSAYFVIISSNVNVKCNFTSESKNNNILMLNMLVFMVIHYIHKAIYTPRVVRTLLQHEGAI